MNAPTGTTLTERTEWVLGLGEPKPPSRYGLAFFALLAAFFVGVLVWYVLAEGWKGVGSSTILASAVLWLWLLSDRVGAFLNARRVAAWGRGLRAFGYATLFPLSMGLYLAYYWSESTFMFVGLSAIMGVGVVWTVLRLLGVAWRGWRPR